MASETGGNRPGCVGGSSHGGILAGAAGFEQQLASDFSRNFVRRTVFNCAE
jgi:hypothetical protein